MAEMFNWASSMTQSGSITNTFSSSLSVTRTEAGFEISLLETRNESSRGKRSELKIDALGTIDVRLEQVPRDGETRNALLVTFSTGPAAAGRSCDSVIALSPDIPAIMNTMKEAILRAARPA